MLGAREKKNPFCLKVILATKLVTMLVNNPV